jgi:hypothetical protein
MKVEKVVPGGPLLIVQTHSETVFVLSMNELTIIVSFYYNSRSKHG